MNYKKKPHLNIILNSTYLLLVHCLFAVTCTLMYMHFLEDIQSISYLIFFT